MQVKYSIEQVMGCWQSYNDQGEPLIYAGSKWECEFWTKELLDNTLVDGKVVNSGVVGGKL